MQKAERYFLIDTEDEVEIIENLYPDVGVAKASEARMRQRTTRTEAAVVRAPVVMATPVARRVPHSRIAIRDVEKRRLVTIIEFLSPTNKRGDGRKQYLRKRNRVLRSATSLVEIDLLRKGLRPPMRGEYPKADYFVVVSRASKRPRADVWPIRLFDSLPAVPVPLLKKDGEVLLDLQAAIDVLYDMGRFKYLIDYRKPPEAALNPDEAAWADRLLRDKGFR